MKPTHYVGNALLYWCTIGAIFGMFWLMVRKAGL